MNIEPGLDFLKNDKNMQVLIKKFGRPDYNQGQDYFQSLLRSIVFQQLSGKAAQTIYERLVSLIPKTSNLCPNEVLKLNKDEMRKAGLSFQKINYVRNLADYFENNSLQKKDVEEMTDEEISKELIQTPVSVASVSFRYIPEFEEKFLGFILQAVLNTSIIFPKIMIIPDCQEMEVQSRFFEGPSLFLISPFKILDISMCISINIITQHDEYFRI